MKDTYQIVKKPWVTEKSNKLNAEHNKVSFKVDLKANKIEIKEAVERLFNVKVASVATGKVKGKKKRVGRYVGITSDWKKAVVTLKEGSQINYYENR